jgi:hypothetical protein
MALAGIASDCRLPAFLVNYSIQTWEVCLQTMQFLLQNTGTADMIAYSGITADSALIGGRPSWSRSFYWAEITRFRPGRVGISLV